jgi:hypothetical protein
MDCTIDNVKYKCYPYSRPVKKHESIKPIGIDTEAFITGQCFMIATSKGDVFQPDQFPGCMFTRKYRGKSFVAYNLKYDMGAFLQNIPAIRLDVLRARGWCFYKRFHYVVISNKCLTIRKGKNGIHIYDMLSFYNMSLDSAAKKYLQEKKEDIFTVNFYPFLVYHYWNMLSKYCIQDAVLVSELAKVLIKRFESYSIYPKKLYSVAYISYQYFRQKTCYVTVKRYWEHEREVLRYAMESYNGGKFEVTTKGTGYFYEYDIVSAYPYEISNLANISWARVVKSKKYRKSAVYGFIRCMIDIPFGCYSPVVMKRKQLNCYPVGQFERTITKTEYEYLISQGADIQIIDAYWLHLDNRQYPYKREINRLVKLKQRFKAEHKELDYQTVKILMNSLYGKQVQLIDKGGYYAAGSNWNPIFGAIITGKCRVRMSALQQKNQSIVAVHTDSIISTERLPYDRSDSIGDMSYETEGDGVILGSGIYQIGNKVKFRGFPLKTPLLELCRHGGKAIKVQNVHAYTWREVVFRGWENTLINRFETVEKKVDINFDKKRLWLDDWTSFKEIEKRNVSSIPLIYSCLTF